MQAALLTFIGALALTALAIAPSLTPCTEEDSTTACYWDGGSNGKGSSYVITFTGHTIPVHTAK